MTAYFPSIYHDELIYSQIARYCQKIGYLAFNHIHEDIFFYGGHIQPSVEFFNKFTDGTLKALTKNITLEDLIMEHTMFPYYAMFMLKENKIKLYNSMLYDLQGFYHRKKVIRYCPECAKLDREKYGEAYWHRIHQISDDLEICPIHNCYLSTLKVNKGNAFLIAEEVIPYDNNVIYCENKLKYDFTKYLTNVFLSKVNLKDNLRVGDFISFKLQDTEYSSVRGKHISLSKFQNDLIEYANKTVANQRFEQQWKIQKILSNTRVDTFDTCLIAMFLNIPANELIEMKLPDVSKDKSFDNEVIRLYELGVTISDISRQLNASRTTVRDTIKSVKKRIVD